MKKIITAALLLLLSLLVACTPAVTTETAGSEMSSDHSNMDGDSMESDNMESDSMESDSMESDSMESDSMESDSMESDSMESDNMESDSMESDSMESDSMESDSMESDSMESDSMESDSMESDSMESDSMESDTTMRPAWQQLPLTNVHTGESFTLADFAGQTVFVETMATWCSNCRRQLDHVKSARAQLGESDTVFVALSVEIGLSDSQLAQYATNAGYDWPFAVISPELLQELADLYGQSVANPPATPHFIIYPDGSTSELVTGIETPDQLLPQLQGMSGN